MNYLNEKKYADLDLFHRTVCDKVSGYTMTSPERIVNVIDSVEYIVKNNIDGDFVECGVWKGGCVMAAIYTLIKLDELDRNIYLYDTFEGMTVPTNDDVAFSGDKAIDVYNELYQNDEDWCGASLQEVQGNIKKLEYPEDKIHFIQGNVEETIPKAVPEKISLLRLDTDWYKSTKHELENLYPLVSEGGVIIIDDYGHWAGARKAVDEYIEDKAVFLHRIDYTGRCIIKC